MQSSLANRDLASQIKVVGLTAQSGVAAGAGDNTEVTSDAIDRVPTGLPMFLSAVFVAAYLTTVQAANTLKITLKISESDDGSSWGADETLLNAVTMETGLVTAKKSAYELGIDLSKRKRYVRFKVTLDLSAGAADTFVYASSLVLGGSDDLPV